MVAAVREHQIHGNALLKRVEVVQPGLYASALIYVAVFCRNY